MKRCLINSNITPGKHGTLNNILSRSHKLNKFPSSYIHNDKVMTDKAPIANAFNTYFTNTVKTSTTELNTLSNKTFKHYMNEEHTHLFCFETIDDEIISKTIDSIQPKTSCGFDGISSQLLKSLKPALTRSLRLITNQILTTGIFPDKLKIVKVVPIYKKGENTQLCNYRPISLLPAISKVIEIIMYSQLDNFFKTQKHLYDNQYRFRTEHSTEFAGLELADRVITCMDHNETPINIYLDLSKAFDTLDHEILMAKLQYYGIHGTPLELVKSYLTNRKQYVEDTKSKMLDISTGVPQCSILGPLLFIIYVNSLPCLARSSNL